MKITGKNKLLTKENFRDSIGIMLFYINLKYNLFFPKNSFFYFILKKKLNS